MLKDETINLLKQLYLWLKVDPTDIDERKYLLLKKFSEVYAQLLGYLAQANHDSDDLQYW